MLDAIARIGMRIEHALGLPQDIEGALRTISGLLSDRPQVGLSHA
jgi:hypothetical protein